MNNVEGKIVFITGGTSGYGKATAKVLRESGAIVVIGARKEQSLIETKEEGVCDDYVVLDVTKTEDWLYSRDYIKNRYGRVDILINNAGGGVAIVDTIDQKFEDIDNIIKLNLNSAIYGSKVFGSMMKDQKSGLIINMSSVCAKEAWPAWTVYASAKWGVLGLSKGLYVEMQPYNIRVTCMIPAAASTGFQKNSRIGEVEQALKTVDVATAILNICNLPEHVCVEEMTIWGTDQVVNPL